MPKKTPLSKMNSGASDPFGKAPAISVEVVEPGKLSGKKAKAKNESKPRKTKMVRDSFTMPEHDYALITVLKERCSSNGAHVKKSELLRAGLVALSKLNGPTLLKRVGQLEKIRTGRPPKK